MTKTFLPAKLLLVSAKRGLGKHIVAAAKRGGAEKVTRFFGPLTERNSADRKGRWNPYQDAAIILLNDGVQGVLSAIIKETTQKRQYHDAIVLTIDVTKVLSRSDSASSRNEESSHPLKGSDMKSGFTMITSITNHGQAEALMAIARHAGAKGGTILDARGSCMEDDIKFLGISLAPEKEVLIIVSEAAKTAAILKVLSDQAIFKEPGGGIIFTVDIDQYISLGT